MKNNQHSWVSIFCIWLLTVLVWGAYRYFYTFSEIVEEFLLKPLMFVGPVVLLLFSKQQLGWENLGFRKVSLRQFIIWGVGFGLVLCSENLLIWWLKGKGLTLNPSLLAQFGLTSIATAVSEEILYRGFICEQFLQKISNPFLANIGQSLLFSLGHVSVALFGYHYWGNELISYLFLIFVIGCAQGMIYQKTRSIWPTISAHALWNFSSVFIS